MRRPRIETSPARRSDLRQTMVRRRLVVLMTVLAVVATALVPGSTAAAATVADRHPTEEVFVDQLYRDLLARPADASGLAFWSSRLRTGDEPAAVAEQILASPELGGAIRPVVRLYRVVFDRAPDLGGLRFWVGRARAGLSAEAMAAAFLASAEFEELEAATSTKAAVTAVYRQGLDREPDAAGLAFWVDAIDRGEVDLARFVLLVSESPENVARTDAATTVTVAYLGLLGRLPEPAGATFWTERIEAGLGSRGLAADLLASPEYQGRFAPIPTITVEEVAGGFVIPWDVEVLPGGDLIVSERGGGLSRVDGAGTVNGITADLSDLWVSGETGLLGLAIDPAFADNGRIYTCQGHTSPREIQVVAWQLTGTTATRVADPLVGGLDVSTGRHGGCQLEFGADGMLWIGTGDAAVGSLPQSVGSLAGKVLRVDPTTGGPAPGNPLIGRGGDAELIWTLGHRNVQGLALRPGTDEVWSVEHGPSRDDEVNRLVQPGGNAGWNPVPGYNEAVPMTDRSLGAGVFDAAWSTGSPTLALSGGDWTGDEWGAFGDALAVAALKNQTLRLLFFSPEGTYLGQRTIIDGGFGRLRAVQAAPDGSLLVTTSTGSDRVLRVTPNVPG